jgi:hypothetical protein
MTATVNCTLYIDPDLDDAVRAQLQLRRARNKSLVSRLLAKGIKALKDPAVPRPALKLKKGVNLVLRTAHLDVSVDERLRHETFWTKVERNDLMRQYLRAGLAVMKTEQAARAARKTKTPEVG